MKSVQSKRPSLRPCQCTGEPCAPERCDTCPGDSVVTSLLKHLPCAHTMARDPALSLQKHRLKFCHFFLPGTGQQHSWPQLQRSTIQEASWHQVAGGSCAREQSPLPSLTFSASTLLQTIRKTGLMCILGHFLPLRHYKLPLTLTVEFPVAKKYGSF